MQKYWKPLSEAKFLEKKFKRTFENKRKREIKHFFLGNKLLDKFWMSTHWSFLFLSPFFGLVFATMFQLSINSFSKNWFLYSSFILQSRPLNVLNSQMCLSLGRTFFIFCPLSRSCSSPIPYWCKLKSLVFSFTVTWGKKIEAVI